MKKCLVIGSTVCDVMIYIDKLPTTQGDINLNKQLVTVGGCAYNVVSMLHYFNVPYTFISPVGTGIYGDFVKKHLKEKQIKTSIQVEQENGCTYCLVEKSGERTFLSYHQAEYTFKREWLNNLNLDDYAYIYVCGLEIEDVNGEELANTLDQFKGQVIFCPGPRVKHIPKERLQAIFNTHPIIHLNELELIDITQINNIEHAVKHLALQTQNTVIVTLGDKGSLFYDGHIHYIDGYQATVVDTIGAGDSHIGSVLAALSVGKSFNKALDFANYVASLIVSTNGVQLTQDDIEYCKKMLSV